MEYKIGYFRINLLLFLFTYIVFITVSDHFRGYLTESPSLNTKLRVVSERQRDCRGATIKVSGILFTEKLVKVSVCKTKVTLDNAKAK